MVLASWGFSELSVWLNCFFREYELIVDHDLCWFSIKLLPGVFKQKHLSDSFIGTSVCVTNKEMKKNYIVHFSTFFGRWNSKHCNSQAKLTCMSSLQTINIYLIRPGNLESFHCHFPSLEYESSGFVYFVLVLLSSLISTTLKHK